MIIDDYAYKNKLFKVNPNIKFSIGMLFLIISLISPYNILSVLIILGMSITIVGIAKIEIKDYIHFIKIPFTFLVISIIMILINFSGDKSILLNYIKVGNLYIGVSKTSIDTFPLKRKEKWQIQILNKNISTFIVYNYGE